MCNCTCGVAVWDIIIALVFASCFAHALSNASMQLHIYIVMKIVNDSREAKICYKLARLVVIFKLADGYYVFDIYCCYYTYIIIQASSL